MTLLYYIPFDWWQELTCFTWLKSANENVLYTQVLKAAHRCARTLGPMFLRKAAEWGGFIIESCGAESEAKSVLKIVQ